MTKLKEAAGEFLAGLTSTNPKAFLSALLVGIALLAALEVVLARGWIWRLDPGWLLSTPYDDWTHALWAVNQLDGESDATAIYLVGGSGSREAVVSNESVEKALTAAGKEHYRFLNLGTRNQSFFESIILIDNLPDASSGLIIFALTPHFFTDDIDDARVAVQGVRFPLYSAALVKALNSVGLMVSGSRALNVVRYRAKLANYLSQRIAGHNLFERLPYKNHLYEGRPPLQGAALEKHLSLIETEMKDYDRLAPLNFAMLEIAVNLAQSKGYRALLVDLPRNPAAEERLYGRVLDSYRRNMDIVVQSTGARHVDLHDQCRFPASYFYDHLHQTDDARVVFQDRFVDLILSQLEAGR